MVGSLQTRDTALYKEVVSMLVEQGAQDVGVDECVSGIWKTV